MTWNVKEQVPSLAVADLDMGIRYYSCIGFELEWRWPRESPSHVGLRNGPAALMLVRSEVRVGVEIYFVVDDVESCYTELCAAQPWKLVHAALGGTEGAGGPASSPPNPPSVKDHQHFDFTIEDPWGHRLTFGREAAG